VFVTQGFLGEYELTTTANSQSKTTKVNLLKEGTSTEVTLGQ
jgi:hypothetical protein